MLLDVLASTLVIGSSVCIFTSYVLSSPSHARWFELAPYLRTAMLLLGALMLFRGVDLAWLAAQPDAQPGHVDGLAVVTALANTFYFAGVAYGLFTTHISVKVQEKIGRAIQQGDAEE